MHTGLGLSCRNTHSLKAGSGKLGRLKIISEKADHHAFLHTFSPDVREKEAGNLLHSRRKSTSSQDRDKELGASPGGDISWTEEGGMTTLERLVDVTYCTRYVRSVDAAVRVYPYT